MSIRICPPVVAAAVAVLLGGFSAQAQDTLREVVNEAFYEHLDEADDAVEALLDWRHVLVNVAADDSQAPTLPKTTLISVSRRDVQELSAVIDAIVATLPGGGAARPATRGDLRAHAEKAQQIAKELLDMTPRAVGTSGAAADVVTVDRTALQRLELEIDAMEQVAPRQLKR